MTACELCGGACCKSIGIHKSLFNAGVIDWVALHGRDEKSHIRLEVPCSLLKDGKCSDYENRPNICKSYPVGNPKCIEAIRLYAPDKLEKIKELI